MAISQARQWRSSRGKAADGGGRGRALSSGGAAGGVGKGPNQSPAGGQEVLATESKRRREQIQMMGLQTRKGVEARGVHAAEKNPAAGDD